MTAYQSFKESLKNMRISVCGIGKNNTPVVLYLLAHGAAVWACDRRSREKIGVNAEMLEKAGATLLLGEGYLDFPPVDMILRTPGMKPYLPEFQKARENGIPVTSEMELFMAYCPVPMIGITGSDGKTTTTAIMAGLLEAAGKKVFLGGNFGNPMLPMLEEITEFASKMRLPSMSRPFSIADVSDGIAVAELSSFQLTGMTVSPSIAVVTNVAPNHLDWHTDMAEYIQAKSNLVRYQLPDSKTVLNADNSITAGFAELANGEVSFFSRKKQVVDGCYLKNGTIILSKNGEEWPVMPVSEILLSGIHNVENYMAAIAAVRDMVPPEIIREFARKFSGVAHRCEFVREWNGISFYNDSIATSPTRTIAGLLSFDKKVILIAGGYDKHIPYDPLGIVASKTIKAAFLMGNTAPAIEQALNMSDKNIPCVHVTSMEQAVNLSVSTAQAGDIVFMSPASASFDLYRDFEERGNHYKSIVNSLI